MGSLSTPKNPLVAMLICDTPHHSVVSRFGDYSKMISKLLQQVDPAIRTVSFDCIAGEFPSEDFERFDAFVVSGSRYGVYEREHEWIGKLEQNLRRLDAAGKKLIGLCFGHQILASALGGKVEKNPAGWEISVTSFELTEEARKFFGCEKDPQRTHLRLQYIHQDHVAVLPPGASNMGGTSVCAVEGFFRGNNVIGFQGHPEFESGVIETLLNLREDHFPNELVTESRQRLSLPTDAEWISQKLVEWIKS